MVDIGITHCISKEYCIIVEESLMIHAAIAAALNPFEKVPKVLEEHCT
jgi:hypothetical protein